MMAFSQDQTNFLMAKSKLSSQLVGTSSKQEYKKKLQETLSQIDNNEESNFNNDEVQSNF